MMVDLVFEQKMFEKPLDLLKKYISNEVYQYIYKHTFSIIQLNFVFDMFENHLHHKQILVYQDTK
jgi:hypothetical protein